MYDTKNPLDRLLGLVIGLALICSAILLLAIPLGYGSLRLELPAGTTATLNGHSITVDSLKLRPGTYTVSMTSAAYNTQDETVHVRPFLPTTLKPELTKRDPLSVVTSTIGSSGLYGKLSLSQPQWLDNNNWLVSLVGPGSISVIAMEYKNNQWMVGYYDGVRAYPHDTSKLPPDVAKVVNNLKAKYE